MQNKLPQWKQNWDGWNKGHPKPLQMTVRRIKTTDKALTELKERGYDVGELKWKAPREYQSICYNQSGFDVDRNTGRAGHATVTFSKIGTFRLNYHRSLPTEQNQGTTIKEVTLKKEKTGEWSVLR
jgi:hypothetical protein